MLALFGLEFSPGFWYFFGFGVQGLRIFGGLEF